MYRRNRFAGLLVLISLALSGCAGTRPTVLAPDVRLGHVEATKLSFSQQKFMLTFDVSNPNPFPLPVRAARYKVMLEQHPFASGETVGSFSVPARGDGSFTISVDLDLMRSATHVAAILATGTSRPLQYELHGSLDVAIPFARALTFMDRGTIVVQGVTF